MQSRKHYITGLKGISCIFIMLGHFIGLNKYAEQFLPHIPLLDSILNSRFSFCINEAFWLYLFFYISGYLVAGSRVNSIKDVVLKSISRFFRFAFPVLFSYLAIYLIYILASFHNGQTADLFQCAWFQGYYAERYSLMHVLRSPIDVLIHGNCALNGPYWVLKDMFFASLIIYALKYVYHILSDKHEALGLALLIAVTFAFIPVSNIIFACLLGMLISVYENSAAAEKKQGAAIIGILLVSLLQYIVTENFVFNIFFVILIILTPRVSFLDASLSKKPFGFLGDISWGIYSFHWPLMCSIGAMLIIALQPRTGLTASYIVSCVAVSTATIVISFIFRITFEKLASFLTAKLDSGIKRIILCISGSKN